jgi:hypothetical protein
MKFQTTRFILSVIGVVLMAALGFFGMFKGDAITPPLCVTGIGTIIGGYQWSRAVTTGKYLENKTVTGG